MTIGASLVTAASFLGPVSAHHGTATSYDQNRIVAITGTVKEFWWRNPHSALFLVGADEAGKPVTYALEMGSPFTLVRMGYTRTTFKPGDKVSLEMHPSHASPTSGESLSRTVIVNGRPLKPAGAAPAAPSTPASTTGGYSP
jgi:hypothetical protein